MVRFHGEGLNGALLRVRDRDGEPAVPAQSEYLGTEKIDFWAPSTFPVFC